MDKIKTIDILKSNTKDFNKGNLKISQNGRFITYDDGKPFFYLGDTAWQLFHVLKLKEAEYYLEDRRKKGFTVIQAAVLSEFDGLNTTNAYGQRPLIDNDPEKPNEDYFKHIDRIVDMACQKGLFIGMLPTWGDKVDLWKWGVGPTRIPDQSVVAGDCGEGLDHIRATRDSEGSYAFVYIPTGKQVRINMDTISGEAVKAYWYNPREGTAIEVGCFTNSGEGEFIPPTEGRDNDWVLILDDVAKEYHVPGYREEDADDRSK